jgi:hypothetical protein
MNATLLIIKCGGYFHQIHYYDYTPSDLAEIMRHVGGASLVRIE